MIIRICWQVEILYKQAYNIDKIVKEKIKFMDMNDCKSKLTTSTSSTETEGKSYTTNYPFEDNYGQYCFNRLPCGICTRTNQMCPLAGNSRQIEVTYLNSLSTKAE